MADQLQPATKEEMEMVIKIKSDRCVELLEFVMGWYNLRIATSEDVRQFLHVLDKISLEEFERKHFLGKELTKYPKKYSRLPELIRKNVIGHFDDDDDEDECTCRKIRTKKQASDEESSDEEDDYSDEEYSSDEEDFSEDETSEVVVLHSNGVMNSEDSSLSDAKPSNGIPTSKNVAENNFKPQSENANNLRKETHMKAEIIIREKPGNTSLPVTEHVSMTIKQNLKESVGKEKTKKPPVNVFSMNDLVASDLMNLWKDAQPMARGNTNKKNNKKNNKKQPKIETDDEFMDRFIKENEKLKQELIEEQFVKYARAGVPDEDKQPKPVMIPPKEEEPPADADYSNLIFQKIAELQEKSLLDLMCKHKFNFGEVIVETARRGVMHFVEDVERVMEKGVTKENLRHRSLDLFIKNFVMPNPDESVDIRSERFENVHDFMWARINLLDKDESKYESVRLFVYIYLLEAMENKKECIVPTLERLMNAHGTNMFDLVEMELLHVVMGEFNGESESDSV
ncbi:unnamed protein product [Caenorhabditis brenneri]